MPSVYDSLCLKTCPTLPVSDPWTIVQLPGSGVPLRPQAQPQEATLPRPADSRAHTIPNGAASPGAGAAFHRASVCSHHNTPQASSPTWAFTGTPITHIHFFHPAPGRAVLGLLLPPRPSLPSFSKDLWVPTLLCAWPYVKGKSDHISPRLWAPQNVSQSSRGSEPCTVQGSPSAPVPFTHSMSIYWTPTVCSPSVEI